MSQRKVKMVRRQIRKAGARIKKSRMEIALDALEDIAALPVGKRLWFAWRIVVIRRFS